MAGVLHPCRGLNHIVWNIIAIRLSKRKDHYKGVGGRDAGLTVSY